ncbi:MAG TPA: OmpA family protein, partial [Tenuifilaceae bacterium]|nr:OmpA family protein [Tenuifilaceae bacterium]
DRFLAVIRNNGNADARGEYMVCIPSNRNYGLFASAEGYLYHSENFSLQGVHSIDKPFRKNIYLKPFAVGQVLVMRNIFFQTDSYELLSESAVELNRLVELLRVNPLVRIEVGGHTDNVGSDSYNQQLSEKRASSVAQYIIGKGIDVGRITWKGYGEQQPMSSNETEEGRAENRRTEIRIVGI